MEGILAVLILLGALVFAWHAAGEMLKQLEAARVAYQSALSRLRADPTAPTKYAEALEAGRTYARMCRDQKKVAIFDELALQNDLMAATAAANRAPAAASTAVPGPSAASQPAPAMGAEQRLLELKTLRDKGLLDESTYEQKRAAILASL